LCGTEMQHIDRDLHACPVCSLISSDLEPDIALYDEEYHAKYLRYAETGLGRRINDKRWDLVNRHMTKGIILDFGCGCGAFVRSNPNGDYRVVGYDINPASGSAGPESLGWHFDAATFWDSIEHLQDPCDMLKRLGPDFVFMTVPDALSLPTPFLFSWRHYRPSEHIHYFSRPALRKMMEVCGYEILEFSTAEGEERSPADPDWLLTMAARKVR